MIDYTYEYPIEELFKLSDEEFDKLSKKLDRSVRHIDLQNYLQEVEALSKDVDVVKAIEESDYLMFDNPDELFDYTIGWTTVEAVHDTVVYEPDLDFDEEAFRRDMIKEKQDTRIFPIDEQSKSILSIMSYLGFESSKYHAKAVWTPYVRQNRNISEMGDFVKDNMVAQIEFPNVGYEVFTNQFQNNLAVMTRTREVVALNNVAHIVYSARPLYSGMEFIIFRITLGGKQTYYLWDNVQIREMVGDGGEQIIFGMCSGIKINNAYYIYYSECFSHNYPSMFSYVEHSYLTSAVINFKESAGVLLNIDGVDYVVPRQKEVVLSRHMNSMMDRSGLQYQVDKLSVGHYGIYAIRKNYVFEYMCDTIRFDDSTQVIERMMNRVVDMMEFAENYLVPVSLSSKIEYIGDKRIMVDVITTKAEILQSVNKGRVPFFKRNADGNSKNSYVMASVNYSGYMTLDSYTAYTKPSFFFFGNVCYNSYKVLKPVLVLSRQDKVLKIKYYSNARGGKYSRFKLKRVQYLNTSKTVELVLRERQFRAINVLTGELKKDFLDYYKEIQRRENKENFKPPQFLVDN